MSRSSFEVLAQDKELYGCKIQRDEEAECFPDVNREGHRKGWGILMGENHLHVAVLPKVASAEDLCRRSKGLHSACDLQGTIPGFA